MVDSPSEQEIQDHLEGLNRTSQAWEASINTVIVKKMGIDNYLRWFRKYGIVTYQDRRSVWRLGSLPIEERKEHGEPN